MRTIRKNLERWLAQEAIRQAQLDTWTDTLVERSRVTATSFVPASLLVLEVKKRLTFGGREAEYSDFVCVNSPGEAFALRGKKHGQGVITKVVRTVW